MLKISPGPQTIFAGCSTGFVSLGCDGSADPLITKASARDLFSTAQISFVTSNPVTLRINDEVAGTTQRGYCFADRVDARK